MEMVVLMGLQASGKSTFCQRFLAGSHLCISKDHFKHNKAYKQQKMLQEALEQGQDLVIDNTNPTRAERVLLIAPARAAGARVVGYFFDSDLQSCLERNARRERVVPEVGVRATRNKFELPDPAEGFDQLYRVQLQKGGFAVIPWEAP